MRREFSSESVKAKSRCVNAQFDKCEMFVKTLQVVFPFTLLVLASLPHPAATSPTVLGQMSSDPALGAAFFNYYEQESPPEVIRSLYSSDPPRPHYQLQSSR